MDTASKNEQNQKKGGQQPTLKDDEPITALYALIHNSTIVLLGDPGSGKWGTGHIRAKICHSVLYA
jgi:hypothetical protein